MNRGEPDLKVSSAEQRKIQERTSVGAVVVHEAIRAEGESELERPASALAWSGLASGLSMGLSLVAEGLLQSHLPEASWRTLIVKLGYPLGFLVVVLGRQQLFTENTLTVILPLLYRRNFATLLNVARLWSVVLLANLIGVWLLALVLRTPAFDPEILNSFSKIGFEAFTGTAAAIFMKAIFAGWLIALMVWLLPAAEGSKPAIIIILTYMVGLGGFPHIVAGSSKILYLAVTGQIGYPQAILHYMLPTLLGNIVGGVSLVAALNHAQVVAGADKRSKQREED